jgi:hypothetical protein
MRNALSNITMPNLPPGKLAPVPDLKYFELPPVLPGNNCNGNNKAISLDINDAPGGLEITICTFLEYELEGVLTTDGFMDQVEEYISLKLDSVYVLKGALSSGVKVTVASLEESPLVELDPTTIQLYLKSDPSGLAQLGLFTATVTGDVSLQGRLSVGYCPSCDGTYPLEDYEQVGENSAFYLSQLVGFDLDLQLELLAGMPGAQLDIGAGLRITDDDIFDDKPHVVQLPDAQVLRDSMKFSPQKAVSKSFYSFWAPIVNTAINVSASLFS